MTEAAGDAEETERRQAPAGRAGSGGAGTASSGSRGFILVANRLPVDRVPDDPAGNGWRRSPGGLVTAVEPVMRRTGGLWVGWPGASGEVPGVFDVGGLTVASVGLSEEEVEDFYEGFANTTLWPLYHDVIVPPQYHRRWWEAYEKVNRRFAAVTARHAAAGATVWVHDYQLQLVPALLRRRRPDLRIGFFDHIPFPGYEIFAQLPWRRQIVQGLLGADLIGFQRVSDATNFLRACRRAAGVVTRPGGIAVAQPDGREVRVGAFGISIDVVGLERLARSPGVVARAGQIRAELGHPDLILMGADRLDYTKGILHRLKAYEELLDEGRFGDRRAVFVQVATPSRERVAEYQALRKDVEGVVGRINGTHGRLGRPAVHYLHHSYGTEEMAALYRAADVMVVTPLRDGMNLVAKEYVACRYTDDGALVLSEFSGAADELTAAFLVNPHDIDGLKDTVVRACAAPRPQLRRRMRAMRRRLAAWDVARWAEDYLAALRTAPLRPRESWTVAADPS
ncbi:MAG TPA: trehalose-6-phosphate synthase [Kineosporiaceae bacterium]|nr:trehalose-6-phosphate synthase [Kineosporiaceae bacterium]